MSADLIPHHAKCKRPQPELRASWTGAPEWWCPSCGRSAAATTTNPKGTDR